VDAVQEMSIEQTTLISYKHVHSYVFTHFVQDKCATVHLVSYTLCLHLSGQEDRP